MVISCTVARLPWIPEFGQIQTHTEEITKTHPWIRTRCWHDCAPSCPRATPFWCMCTVSHNCHLDLYPPVRSSCDHRRTGWSSLPDHWKALPVLAWSVPDSKAHDQLTRAYFHIHTVPRARGLFRNSQASYGVKHRMASALGTGGRSEWTAAVSRETSEQRVCLKNGKRSLVF